MQIFLNRKWSIVIITVGPNFTNFTQSCQKLLINITEYICLSYKNNFSAETCHQILYTFWITLFTRNLVEWMNTKTNKHKKTNTIKSYIYRNIMVNHIRNQILQLLFVLVRNRWLASVGSWFSVAGGQRGPQREMKSIYCCNCIGFCMYLVANVYYDYSLFGRRNKPASSRLRHRP